MWIHFQTGYWSCWSEWSKCSKTEPCAQPRGVQRRFRTCINQFNSPVSEMTQIHNTSLCYGGFEHSVQTVPCELEISETNCLQQRLNQVRYRKRSVEAEQLDIEKPCKQKLFRYIYIYHFTSNYFSLESIRI